MQRSVSSTLLATGLVGEGRYEHVMKWRPSSITRRRSSRNGKKGEMTDEGDRCSKNPSVLHNCSDFIMLLQSHNEVL